MSLRNKTVVLRADGSAQRGIGHLMRCLSLADGIVAVGGTPILATIAPPSVVETLYKERGFGVVSLEEHFGRSVDQLQNLKPDWLVIDSYDITAAQRAVLATAARHTAIFDDAYDNGPYEADLIINPNPYSEECRYKDVQQGTQIAVGGEYVLLRSDILNAKQPRSTSKLRHVLISCGGSDPAGAAKSCLDMLAGVPGDALDIHVLSGPLSPVSTPLHAGIHKVTALPPSMAIQDHLNWADIAVLTAGTAQWEAAYLGCPFIALIVADNQAAGAQAFAKAGGSIALDWRGERRTAPFLAAFESLQQDASQQAQRAQNLIDGQGARRIAALLDQIV